MRRRLRASVVIAGGSILFVNGLILSLHDIKSAAIAATVSTLLVWLILKKCDAALFKPLVNLANASESLAKNLNGSVYPALLENGDPSFLADAFAKLINDLKNRENSLIREKKRSEETIKIIERLAEDTMMANVDLENEIIERMKAEAQLRESEEKYRNLFDFAPDGVNITNKEGDLISFNNAAMRVFKYDDLEEFSKLTAMDFYMHPERDRTALVKSLYEKEHIESYEVEFRDRDGSPFTASLSLSLIMYEGKQCIQSTVRDVTRIKKMEADLRDYAENLEKMVNEKTAELQSANRELSDTVMTLEQTREQLALSAHRAGMAEIAVSILHNIGNSINSINVRMYHLEEKLKNDDVESLNKLFGLLQSKDVFLLDTEDRVDRREKLLKYFSATIDSLSAAFGDLKSDCEFIKKALDHLMEIITLQQKYAGVRGFETSEDINELIEDSLDMLMDSIRKRQIDVEISLVAKAEIRINKNKMIQILINMIKNAYEAIDLAPGNEKKIRLETGLENSENRKYVRIIISDTGAGVPPEIMDKVFRFNFSTKARGSGFGLHDAANYINAQNGTIRLFSEGHSKGSRVEIRLPVSNGEKNK